MKLALVLFIRKHLLLTTYTQKQNYITIKIKEKEELTGL